MCMCLILSLAFSLGCLPYIIVVSLISSTLLLWLQIKVFLTIIIILMCLTVSYCHIFDMYAPHLITHTIMWCDILLIIVCSTIMRSIIIFCYNVYVCSVCVVL